MSPVRIVGMGASTAVGRDAWSAAAAVRAGLAGFTQHPFMVDTAGEPMRVALAPWLDIDLEGTERLAALLFPAIDQACMAISPVFRSRAKWGIALGLPGPKPGIDDAIGASLKAHIASRYGARFSAIATFASGHAAGSIAMAAAQATLGNGTLDACIVAGVDSYMHPETLEWLEQNDQLHGAGALNNAWGFVPGEAAGALALMAGPVAHASGIDGFAAVLATGSAVEAKRIKTETVCIGEGLTSALRGALAALPAQARVSDLYCDLNGEPYRADEFGFAALRTKDSFVAVSDFVAPADCWGDVGAAGGPLHVMLAAIGGHKGYARGPLALAWSSAETGERAATLLAKDGFR